MDSRAAMNRIEARSARSSRHWDGQMGVLPTLSLGEKWPSRQLRWIGSMQARAGRDGEGAMSAQCYFFMPADKLH